MSVHTPRHLSASRVTTYLRCPQKYYRAYVLGKPTLATPEMQLGSAVHKAIEAHHAGEDAQRAFAQWWRASREFMATNAMTVPAGLTVAADALLDLYLSNPCPDGKTEMGWTVRLPGVPVPVTGFYDLVDIKGRIWEHKTSAYPWQRGRAESELQGRLYLAAAPYVLGCPAEGLTYTIMSYQLGSQLRRFSLDNSDEEDAKVVETCNAVLAGMAAGEWEPRCRPGRCAYPDGCGRVTKEDAA
jgi:CRISPR/Cas system-associated exonuclease Cas4 (RecB family)